MRCADGRRPASPHRMAVPPVWNSRRRELLPAMRPSDRGVGVSGPAESIRREIDSLRPVDVGARRLHRVRDHGLRGARVQSGVRGPRDPGDPVRRDREQCPRLQRELDPQRMGDRFVVVVPVDGREYRRLPPDGSAELGCPWILDAIVPSRWLRAIHRGCPTRRGNLERLDVRMALHLRDRAAHRLAACYHLIRERKVAWDSFKAPLEAIGKRLKSRSAWIAIAQVWMAVTCFQIIVYYLVVLAGFNPTSPINITNTNAWVWLFGFANAGVYEELTFRLLLIGVPMALGSLIVRITAVRRGASGHEPGSTVRHTDGARRYVLGGVLRNDSPKEALAVGWALLFASSAIFGLAHAPGWGLWKVVPAMVAGLGFGYLFLRHGIGAAILAHFVNDYAITLSYEGVGGEALMILIELLVLGLAVAGAGFLGWYAIDAWRHLRSLVDRFRPRAPAAPVPATPSDYGSPAPQAALSPGAPGPSMPPPPMWSAPPPHPIAAVAVPNRGRIPRDYTPSYVRPPYGHPPVRFQCPYRAWVEAPDDSAPVPGPPCARTA